MPMSPLPSVSRMPSAKNCSMMLRLVAPRALRNPISRVRSVTATSMMLMTPMAPSASVTRADGAEEFVHGIEDGAHHLRLLDRVPAFEGVFIVIIEVVIAGDDAARLILGEQVFVGNAGLIVEERNCVVATPRP